MCLNRNIKLFGDPMISSNFVSSLVNFFKQMRVTACVANDQERLIAERINTLEEVLAPFDEHLFAESLNRANITMESWMIDDARLRHKAWQKEQFPALVAEVDHLIQDLREIPQTKERWQTVNGIIKKINNLIR